MSDFQKSVDRDEPKFGWIGVSPIEKDKKRKDHLPESTDGDASKSFLAAAFIVWFKKFINIFSNRLKSQDIAVDQQQLLEDLLAFRKMLQILGNEDQSHNPEFTQQFSELWHNLIDDCNQVESLKQKNQLNISQIKLFINSMHSFPSSEEHSLGYYLSKYVGNEWLPFPFMDILHQLHQDYQESVEGSQLNQWVSMLNNAISSLGASTDLNNF
ncbi:MAG TPA: hypothetical protein VLG49_01930 [Rhabdochlamydiaceae bacterium]|nr:hypothetical protein [Rhabdochlamydiaceae bacterium]